MTMATLMTLKKVLPGQRTPQRRCSSVTSLPAGRYLGRREFGQSRPVRHGPRLGQRPAGAGGPDHDAHRHRQPAHLSEQRCETCRNITERRVRVTWGEVDMSGTVTVGRMRGPSGRASATVSVIAAGMPPAPNWDPRAHHTKPRTPRDPQPSGSTSTCPRPNTVPLPTCTHVSAASNGQRGPGPCGRSSRPVTPRRSNSP